MNAIELIRCVPRLSEEQRERAVQLLARIEDLERELTAIVQSPAGSNGAIELRDRGVSEEQAAELRSRLKCFAADWERPEAAIYDEDPAR